jgi:hypothetical protein
MMNKTSKYIKNRTCNLLHTGNEIHFLLKGRVLRGWNRFCKRMGDRHWWVGGDGGERDRRMNMMQIMYIYMNVKMIPAETVAGIRGGGMKEISRRGEFKYDTLDTL